MISSSHSTRSSNAAGLSSEARLAPNLAPRDMVPTRRPSPLHRNDELISQQGQLHHRRTFDAANLRVYSQRCHTIFQRRLTLSTYEGTMASDSVLGTWRGRFAQQCVTSLLQPATWSLYAKRLIGGAAHDFVEEGVQQGWAERVTFWANDEGAALLDGVRLARSDVRDAQSKPHLLFVSGALQTYESFLPQAKAWANDWDIVVVLYNSRGIGRSVGRQLTLEQAVEDCKGVIGTLLGEGHTHLGTYGVSLGAAILFRALEELSTGGTLGLEDVALAAGIRAPASLPHLVGAHFGLCGKRLTSWLLRRLNLPDMDMTRMMNTPLGAKHLLLTSAKNDRWLRVSGQLTAALHLREGRNVLPSGQSVMVALGHGEHHTDLHLHHAPHDAVLDHWQQSARLALAADAVSADPGATREPLRGRHRAT